MPRLAAAGVGVNTVCREGEAPLHRAARLGWSECVEELLSLQAEVGLRNHQRLTALDIAGQYDGRTVLKARTAVRKAILRLAPAQRTLVLYHDDCLGHATPDYHQVTHTFSSAW